MSHAQRLARLEARMPPDDRPWFERLFSFRVAGRGRANVIVKLMQRLWIAINDSRATDRQRAQWWTNIRACVRALEFELDHLHKQQKPLPDLSVIRALGVLSPCWQGSDSEPECSGPPGESNVGCG